MNIKKIHNLLVTLNVAGIDTVNILTNENGEVYAYASDNVVGVETSPSVAVISKLDDDIIGDASSMGVHRVSTMLKRLDLFDINEVKVDTTIHEEHGYITRVKFKQGRKSTTVTCADPQNIISPTGKMEDNITVRLTLTSDDILRISKANSAMSASFLKFINDDSKLYVELSDTLSDVYRDLLMEDSGCDINWSDQWRINSVLRLLKHENKNSDEVVVSIGESGVMYMTVGGIDMFVLSQVE